MQIKITYITNVAKLFYFYTMSLNIFMLNYNNIPVLIYKK